MKYLISKIQIFIMLHHKEISMLILVLVYLFLIRFNSLCMISSCAPTSADPGLPACLEAQKLAQASERLMENGHQLSSGISTFKVS